jgi:hypothetical protein
MNLFYGGQLFQPGGQPIALGWVDANRAVTNDDAQVVDRRSFKFTFGGLQKETLSLQKVKDVVYYLSVEG